MDKLSEKLADVLHETIDALSQVEEDIIKAALGRLSAYEETGLSPEAIVQMGMMFADSKRYSGRLELKLKPYLDIGLSPAELNALKLASMGKCIAEIKEFDGIAIDRLRELAQADKERRLIVPPCKPGDTIWWADRNFHETPVQEIVLSVTAYVNGNVWINCVAREHRVSSIGKTVFLTREEAEKALEGGPENVS